MNRYKILLVEDELSFGSVLESYLKLSDFEVVWAKDGEEGLLQFQKEKFDLCVLDIMMPKMDGFELAQKIQKHASKTPLLFLTAKSLKEDILKGYELGASDFISKPFDSEVLLCKIKAILSISQVETKKSDSKASFEFGQFNLNTNKRELKHSSGSCKKLSPKELKLLLLLLDHKNSILSRELALKDIWGHNDYFAGRSMDVYITKLRKYLKGDTNIQIINIHAEGFILQIEP